MGNAFVNGLDFFVFFIHRNAHKRTLIFRINGNHKNLTLRKSYPVLHHTVHSISSSASLFLLEAQVLDSYL